VGGRGHGREARLGRAETLIQNALSGNYSAQVWRQFGAQDPDGDYVWWASSNTEPPLALNMARNRDPQVDAALDAGRSSVDEAARKQAYADLQRRFTADLPYLYLNHTPWAVVADLTVRDVAKQTLPDGTPSAGVLSGVHRLTQVWLEQ
jgi:4-phytase/acid phosphatase/peptide/nickel transport system substrate-binding protein